MTFDVRHDSWPELRAVHEAGHAIVAVRKGILFSSVSISAQPDSGGRVMISRDAPTTSDFIVFLYAGVEAADFILKLEGAFYEDQLTGDMRMIDSTVSKMGLLSPVDQGDLKRNCRQSAKRIVRIPHVAEAIQLLAKELLHKENLSEARVKAIYSACRLKRS